MIKPYFGINVADDRIEESGHIHAYSRGFAIQPQELWLHPPPNTTISSECQKRHKKHVWHQIPTAWKWMLLENSTNGIREQFSRGLTAKLGSPSPQSCWCASKVLPPVQIPCPPLDIWQTWSTNTHAKSTYPRQPSHQWNNLGRGNLLLFTRHLWYYCRSLV